jgi:hypothetical protein
MPWSSVVLGMWTRAGSHYGRQQECVCGLRASHPIGDCVETREADVQSTMVASTGIVSSTPNGACSMDDSAETRGNGT